MLELQEKNHSRIKISCSLDIPAAISMFRCDRLLAVPGIHQIAITYQDLPIKT